MVQVDYSNEESLKHALAGVHVVISTVSVSALDVQLKVAAAGKEAGVQLLVPSDFGGMLSDATKGLYATKVNTHRQLKALGMPYAAFYTGMFVDMAWIPCVVSIQLCVGRFRPANYHVKGSSTSMSRAGKCPLAATGTPRLRSPPDPMSPDMLPMS